MFLKRAHMCLLVDVKGKSSTKPQGPSLKTGGQNMSPRFHSSFRRPTNQKIELSDGRRWSVSRPSRAVLQKHCTSQANSMQMIQLVFMQQGCSKHPIKGWKLVVTKGNQMESKPSFNPWNCHGGCKRMLETPRGRLSSPLPNEARSINLLPSQACMIDRRSKLTPATNGCPCFPRSSTREVRRFQ